MIEDATTQLRRGVVEYCVLGFLAAEPMYGWQLASALTERDLIASIGTLYPLLGRLRDRGLIVAFEQEQELEPEMEQGLAQGQDPEQRLTPERVASPGTAEPASARPRGTFRGKTPGGSGPTRKYYRLTPLGERQLDSFRAQWGPFTASVTEIIERARP